MHTTKPLSDTERQALEAALATCASEPIHRPGLIQNHGVLLALDPADLTIRHASANLARVFPLEAEAALGRPLEDLIGSRQALALRNLPGLGVWREAAVSALELERDGRSVRLDCRLSRNGEHVLLEVETEPAREDDLFHALFIPIRDALWQLDALTDMHVYAASVVDQIRLLSGFDRVMRRRPAEWCKS